MDFVRLLRRGSEEVIHQRLAPWTWLRESAPCRSISRGPFIVMHGLCAWCATREDCIMGWVQRLFGRGKRRVRKQPNELTAADWECSKVWEFCLDEEGVDGQDESTVRPRPDVSHVRVADYFDGGVACVAQLASGRQMPGAIWLTLTPDCSVSELIPRSELHLPSPAQELSDEPLPGGWNQIVYADCTRMGFVLALKEHLPDDKALPLIRLAYNVLGEGPGTLWPIRFTPAVPIEGLPATWEVEGWYRPGGEVVR